MEVIHSEECDVVQHSPGAANLLKWIILVYSTLLSYSILLAIRKV